MKRRIKKEDYNGDTLYYPQFKFIFWIYYTECGCVSGFSRTMAFQLKNDAVQFIKNKISNHTWCMKYDKLYRDTFNGVEIIEVGS
ncbi:unnamed protein product [marine sediment metagenome]|uniref:Uncharacterized protein n=1 Tax=marine sediment metagenome TaxID=412755 RepID=X1G2J4_9ZZZZ